MTLVPLRACLCRRLSSAREYLERHWYRPGTIFERRRRLERLKQRLGRYLVIGVIPRLRAWAYERVPLTIAEERAREAAELLAEALKTRITIEYIGFRFEDLVG